MSKELFNKDEKIQLMAERHELTLEEAKKGFELLEAASADDHEKVKDLLEEGVYPDVQDINTDFTPLHHAIVNEDVELVKLLIKFKADVRIPTYGEEKPLLLAVKKSNAEIIQILLDNDAWIWLRDEDCTGKNALDYAKEIGDQQIIDLIESEYTNEEIRYVADNADKTFEEAKKALEECDWDKDEAVRLLIGQS